MAMACHAVPLFCVDRGAKVTTYKLCSEQLSSQKLAAEKRALDADRGDRLSDCWVAELW